VDKWSNVAAQDRNLAHQARRNIRVLLGRCQEHGLQLRRQTPVHVGQLKLEFKIRHSTQAAQNDIGFLLQCEFRQQLSNPITRTFLYGARISLANSTRWRNGRNGFFVLVRRYRHDDFAEQFGGTLHQINVAVGDRVERAGVDRDSFHSGRIYPLWRRTAK